MKLRFIDGYAFTADTKQGACEALWHSMRFSLYDTLSEWMTANAGIMQNAFSVTLRSDSPEHHFDDMIKHRILEKLTCF